MPLHPPIHRPSRARAKTPLAQTQKRPTSTQMGYDADWRRLRAAFLSAHPLCMCDDCQEGKKRVTLATVVDHIEPIAERPDLRLEWSNLRSMSKPHHDRHTARTRGFGRARLSQRTRHYQVLHG
jgi:5-methylcytosine-specific restriction protein A